jgi:Mg/Co/Ni transporter MgtE
VKRIPHKSLLKSEYPVEKVIDIMTKYDLNMAAVVDEKNKMLGVVTIDDVMRHMVPKA